MKLDEIFSPEDNHIVAKVLQNSRDTIITSFTSGDGIVYHAKYLRINWLTNPNVGGYDVWVFDFGIWNPERRTYHHRGDEEVGMVRDVIRVMSYAINILRKNIAQTSPDIVVYVGSDDRLTRAYKHLSKKISPPSGYKSAEFYHGQEVWAIYNNEIDIRVVDKISGSVISKNLSSKR